MPSVANHRRLNHSEHEFMEQHYADVGVHKQIMMAIIEASRHAGIYPLKLLNALLTPAPPAHPSATSPPCGVHVEALDHITIWHHRLDPVYGDAVWLWFDRMVDPWKNLPISWNKIRKILSFYRGESIISKIVCNSSWFGAPVTAYETELHVEATEIHYQTNQEALNPLGASGFGTSTIKLETDFFEKYFLSEEIHNRYIETDVFWDCDAPNFWTAFYNRLFDPELRGVVLSTETTPRGRALQRAITISDYLQDADLYRIYVLARERELAGIRAQRERWEDESPRRYPGLGHPSRRSDAPSNPDPSPGPVPPAEPEPEPEPEPPLQREPIPPAEEIVENPQQDSDVKEKLHEMSDLIDEDVKEKIPEGIYLKLMNLMKDIHEKS